MNRLFRLGPVLRARKAQEDAAKGAVHQSRQEIREAQALVKRRQLDLAGADAPTEGTARAMVASMVARQSMAATISGAHRMVADAEELGREKQAELADAAKRRRAVELMAERHAETVKAHDLKIEQLAVDEMAVTAKARNAARGIDAVSEERALTLRHGKGTAADREDVARETANSVAAQRHTVNLTDADAAIAAARAPLTLAAKRNAEPAEVENEDHTDDGSRA
ncbi:flagellar export protein FliJ [Actinoplanes sp. NPDC049599]|uniref:flagellar export protein FliJ n=1 Tax=Actinoplanes sp. NPDC049599 TaxID=3363903 RepID=UPI0037B4DE36